MAKITEVSKETERIMRNKSPADVILIICMVVISLIFIGVSI